MSEQIKITEESFESLKNMLNSEDTDNTKTALTAICNLDFKVNIVYILLLFKECNVTANKWEHWGETVYTMLSSLADDINKGITFKKSLEILVQYEAPIEDLQFFLNRFSTHLADTLYDLGYKEIDTIELTIKTK